MIYRRASHRSTSAVLFTALARAFGSSSLLLVSAVFHCEFLAWCKKAAASFRKALQPGTSPRKGRRLLCRQVLMRSHDLPDYSI
jgi:hypothetical protein